MKKHSYWTSRIPAMVWLIAAVFYLIFPVDALAVTTNYRSIGIQAGPLHNTGTATVTAGSNRVTFVKEYGDR